MWFNRVATGFRGWISVTLADGTLDDTLDLNNFIVTIVAPDDSASTLAGVAASTQKGGLYIFDVDPAFLLAHGVGNYGVVIEIDTGIDKDAYTSVLAISEQDFDTLGRLVDDAIVVSM